MRSSHVGETKKVRPGVSRGGLCGSSGKPVARVARDLGINEGTLGNWFARDRAEREGTNGLLATQEHLQAAVGKERAERSQAFPRVLVKEPDAGVEGGTTPALDTPVPSVVDVLTGPHHVFHGHSGCHQALVRVPKDELCDTDLSLRIHVVKYVPSHDPRVTDEPPRNNR